MLKEKLYFYLYSDKDLKKELLDLLTVTYIEFSKIQKDIVNEPAGNHYYFSCKLPSGVKISKDYGLEISPEMYEKFCKSYNERVAEAMNGISLLVCEDLDKKRLEK